jgi:mono/diheme cytochrome c family protein
MFNQPKYKPLQASTFFADGRASRPLPEDTVPFGGKLSDELRETGRVGGVLSDRFPFPVTAEILDRGQQRYQIFCSVCHGSLGDGNGMVVQRGFQRPPSFHTDRLRQAPAGHFFEVITNGSGAMYDYRARVTPEDRWAIAAYIRALQRSQNTPVSQIPPAERSKLEAQR